MRQSQLQYTFKHFSELTTLEFYTLAKLRVDVFVVEQACIYPEFDGYDANASTVHVQAINSAGELVAYARLLYGDLKQEGKQEYSPQSSIGKTVRIGRVIVAAQCRGAGLARELMEEIIAVLQRQDVSAIELSAQTYVVPFYESLGFAVQSDEYLEDGIAHKDMRFIQDPSLSSQLQQSD